MPFSYFSSESTNSALFGRYKMCCLFLVVKESLKALNLNLPENTLADLVSLKILEIFFKKMLVATGLFFCYTVIGDKLPFQYNSSFPV